MPDRIFNFSIPGFASQREWCVYIIVATSHKTKLKSLYVGKVGDNNKGCNPIISRIGNHLSHNNIHSQLRNRLKTTTDFDYNIHFATFGSYVESNKHEKDKINELERQLNTQLQDRILGNSKLKLENAYMGKGYILKSEREYRKTLVTKSDVSLLQKLIDNSLS